MGLVITLMKRPELLQKVRAPWLDTIDYVASLDVDNILQLETQGIHLSPQEYIDLGGG